jgi:hypothetical protein
MFVRGSYQDPRLSDPRFAAIQNAYEAKEAQAISNVIKASDLPVKEATFRVSLGSTLQTFKNNDMASVWKLDGGSNIHSNLMNRDAEGKPIGDLRKCLIHSVSVSNLWSSADQEIGFTVTPFPAKMLTRDNRAFVDTITPGYSNREISVYTRTDEEVNLAQIDMQGFTKQDIDDGVFRVSMPQEAADEETWVVKKNTRVARAVYAKKNIEKSYIHQHGLYLEAVAKGKINPNITPFKPRVPFKDPGIDSPFLTVMADYAQVAKSSALEKAEKLATEKNPYLTSLYDLSVAIRPLDCPWKDMENHITVSSQVGMMKDFAMTKAIAASMTLKVRYTICDGPDWSVVPTAKTTA